MSYYAHADRTSPTYCANCRAQIIGQRVPLTKRQAEILAFIRAQITERGFAPSFDEIGNYFQYRSGATVHEHLQNLERKGYILRRYNEARSIELVDAPLAPAAVAT